jgi:hypothetical protein
MSTPADAVKQLEREQGITIIRDEEYQEPIIEQARAEKFVEYAHKNLMENFDLREFYGKKRKIFNLSTITKYRLGFVESQKFNEWHSWQITGWVLPVTNCRTELLAVKIHQEKRLRTQPKCLWCPFGTYPSDKPKNGTLTFWPAPEQFESKDFLIVAPGELKALALIDAGYQATSPTAGESKLPERMLKRLAVLNFSKIFINYDDDPTGRDFRDFMIKSLSAMGILAIPFSYAIDIKKILTPISEPRIDSGEFVDDNNLVAIEKEWLFKNLDYHLKLSKGENGVIPEISKQLMSKLSREEKNEWFNK